MKTEWVDCPICGESDMKKTTDEDDFQLIFCINGNCGSNGGTNINKIIDKLEWFKSMFRHYFFKTDEEL